MIGVGLPESLGDGPFGPAVGLGDGVEIPGTGLVFDVYGLAEVLENHRTGDIRQLMCTTQQMLEFA